MPAAAGVARVLGLAGGGPVTTENARFMAMPWPVVLHIACAAVFCVLGAFQFDPAIRLRYPRWHRLAGRVLAPAGIVAALTAIWKTHWYAIPAKLQGELLYVVRMVAGIGWALAIMLAVRAVLNRRITEHSAWMVRAYALGQGAGTQVLIMLPFTVAFGAPSFFARDLLMTLAWGLNVVLGEWIIHRHLPSTNFY